MRVVGPSAHKGGGGVEYRRSGGNRRGRNRRTLWVVIGVTAVVLIAAFVATAIATDRSAFCKSCHEMQPYYDAWAEGSHSDVACIECHVDSGVTSRLAHKFVALGEVVAHVQGDTSFPRAEVPEVPNERCQQCHAKPGPKNAEPGFSHAEHEKRAQCQHCHPDVGHEVTAEDLKAAGIYDAEAAKARQSQVTTGAPAAIDAGVANIEGHVKVGCTRCHDMQATGCPACHKPPTRGHVSRTDCPTCHKPGDSWRFVHPTSTDCASCHKRPAENHPKRDDCATCHKAGESWAFVHPKSKDCASCHKRPAENHPKSNDCASCHKAGASWAFVHPANKDCASCHNKPARHFAGACSKCHTAGVPFKQTRFAHPATAHNPRTIPCGKCHPSGGSAVSCTCHGGGRSGGD